MAAAERAWCQTTAGGQRRASAFGRALAAHLAKMRSEPGAYGQLGLSDLFEMREECLREFGFSDVYRCGCSPRAVEKGAGMTCTPTWCLFWLRLAHASAIHTKVKSGVCHLLVALNPEP